MKSAVNALIEVGSQASDVVKVGKAVHDVCITGNNTSVGAEEVGEHAKAMSESRAETVKDLLDKRNSNQPIDKVRCALLLFLLALLVWSRSSWWW